VAPVRFSERIWSQPAARRAFIQRLVDRALRLLDAGRSADRHALSVMTFDFGGPLPFAADGEE
jgi:hypothetical protein